MDVIGIDANYGQDARTGGLLGGAYVLLNKLSASFALGLPQLAFSLDTVSRWAVICGLAPVAGAQTAEHVRKPGRERPRHLSKPGPVRLDSGNLGTDLASLVAAGLALVELGQHGQAVWPDAWLGDPALAEADTKVVAHGEFQWLAVAAGGAWRAAG